jgi:hypothetical protein
MGMQNEEKNDMEGSPDIPFRSKHRPTRELLKPLWYSETLASARDPSQTMVVPRSKSVATDELGVLATYHLVTSWLCCRVSCSQRNILGVGIRVVVIMCTHTLAQS